MGNKAPTLDEQMRESKRMINRSIRELDRERTKLQAQERKLIAEIKKLAKAGQMGSVKVLAKDLVRARRNVTKFYEMRSQLQAVELRLQTIKSTNAMADAMKNVTKAMVRMSKVLSVPGLQKILQEFMRENERMEMTEEMMGDAVDMALGDEEDAMESDAVVNQVLSEIGVEIGGQLESGHLPGVREEAKQEVAVNGGLDDLETRFKNLQ